MSLEFAEDNIRVNGICPGAINTPMLMDGLKRNKDKTVEENKKTLESKHPCNFIGNPNDISEMCLFLSDNNKSRYIYGQNIVIDGGATIKLSTE
jgi:NAD(P)-dependent dehydrogenase (short-subunit alcohol dehydrogenase family)